LGYREMILEIKLKLLRKEPVWIPDKKALAVPPDFVIWLGTEEPKVVRVRCHSQHRFARYVLTGKVDENAEIYLATDDDIRECKEILDRAAKEMEKIEEPYRSRLAEILVLKKLSI